MAVVEPFLESPEPYSSNLPVFSSDGMSAKDVILVLIKALEGKINCLIN